MDTEALTDRDKRLIAMSQATGLAVLTCEDLLNKGWTYVTEINKPQMLLGPLHRLQARKQ